MPDSIFIFAFKSPRNSTLALFIDLKSFAKETCQDKFFESPITSLSKTLGTSAAVSIPGVDTFKLLTRKIS